MATSTAPSPQSPTSPALPIGDPCDASPATTLRRFNPTPHTESLLFDQLADPNLSLAQVARNHHTTVDALSLWLTQPRLAHTLNIIQSAAAAKARLAASCQLPRAVAMLTATIERGEQDQTHEPTDHSLPALSLRIRQRSTCLRAAHLLLRIANYNPICSPHDNAAAAHRRHHNPHPAPAPSAATNESPASTNRTGPGPAPRSGSGSEISDLTSEVTSPLAPAPALSEAALEEALSSNPELVNQLLADIHARLAPFLGEHADLGTIPPDLTPFASAPRPAPALLDDS